MKVPVKKTWVGPKGSEVVVKLLADGNPVDGQEVKLNEGNGWKGEFKNLPKYNANGSAIKYTVTEAQVSGVDGDKYNSNIDGDAEHGFTITNTNKETVQIPVIKTWVGGEADKVVIRLLADGKEIASKELSKANGWKHTFKGLKKYNDEKLIVYTIKEDKVSGFKSKISGNARDGFKVTIPKSIIKNRKIIIKIAVENARQAIRETWQSGSFTSYFRRSCRCTL